MRAVPDPRDVARPAFRAWPEIRSRLRAAKRWAFFLDFDGTLVNLRNRPGDVRMPAQAGRILQRLVTHTNVFVAIVSGRSLKDLRRLVNVNGLHYFGLHGAERDGKLATLSSKARAALQSAKRAARLHLGVIRGIWIEDKGLSFSVHHRDADAPAFARADAALAGLVATVGRCSSHLERQPRVGSLAEGDSRESPPPSKMCSASFPPTLWSFTSATTGPTRWLSPVLPNQITVRVGREPTTLRAILRAHPGGRVASARADGKGANLKATEAFQFATASYLVRIGNQAAANLLELEQGLADCSDASIFYHTFQSLGRHHFLTEGFSNDFAQWVLGSCNRPALAEQMASVDIRDYVSLVDLRNDLRKVVRGVLPRQLGYRFASCL